MNDIDDRVRELLRNKATEVPFHDELPRPLARRIRRRIAFNTAAVTIGVVAIAAGAFTGVRSLRAENPTVIRPAVSPTAQQTTPTAGGSPAAAQPAACTSEQLTSRGMLGGAAGSRVGSIELVNHSTATCTLQGRPTIALQDGNGTEITSGVIVGQSPPQWEANGSPEPSGWPVVTLSPGHSASVRFRWSNWCMSGIPAIRIDFGSDGSVTWNSSDPPPCNGPGQPSTIDVGPFEPASS